jgi:hypothetical protein
VNSFSADLFELEEAELPIIYYNLLKKYNK